MKSEEQIFNLSIEECKIIELEEPIKVCLLSLDKWDADISIKSVNITEEIPNKINNVPSSASGSISVNIENKDIPVEEKNIYLRKIILIIIILGILIGLFFKFRKKKKVDNDNN
jgi:hypothetical protein